MINYFTVQVFWDSPRTKRKEMVYAQNLTIEQANSLLGRITNRLDWSELKSLIETHENSKISYLLGSIKQQNDTFLVYLTVAGVK